MFIINRCFSKTSGLNHKWFMLHCLVFKEQLCLSKLAFVWKALLQATHLLYRISFSLSRTFLFFFLSESSAPARRFQSRSIFLPGRCLAATCIILQDAQAFVNRYLELFSKKVAWDLGFAEMRHDTKKASLSRCSSPYGRGSWTRTNACGIQRPVPYQLGDTPVSSASRCQQKLL